MVIQSKTPQSLSNGLKSY